MICVPQELPNGQLARFSQVLNHDKLHVNAFEEFFEVSAKGVYIPAAHNPLKEAIHDVD